MMDTHPDFSAEELQQLRQAVSNKGMELNEKLTKLMAGMDVTLADLSGLELPTKKEDKKQRLKAYLNQISKVLQSFNAGTYGRCKVTGRWIPAAVLSETPWTVFHPDVPEEQRTTGVSN